MAILPWYLDPPLLASSLVDPPFVDSSLADPLLILVDPPLLDLPFKQVIQ